MMPNPYLYEKLAHAHHEKLLREAEQQRLLVPLPQYRESWLRHWLENLVPSWLHLAQACSGLSQRVNKPSRTWSVAELVARECESNTWSPEAGALGEEDLHTRRFAKEASA